MFLNCFADTKQPASFRSCVVHAVIIVVGGKHIIMAENCHSYRTPPHSGVRGKGARVHLLLRFPKYFEEQPAFIVVSSLFLCCCVFAFAFVPQLNQGCRPSEEYSGGGGPSEAAAEPLRGGQERSKRLLQESHRDAGERVFSLSFFPSFVSPSLVQRINQRHPTSFPVLYMAVQVMIRVG